MPMPDAHSGLAGNANDRLKARWNGYLAWSTLAAVALHAAAFAFWPSWEPSALAADAESELVWMEWTSLADRPSAGASAGGIGAPPLSSLSDSTVIEPSAEGGDGGSAADLAGLSDVLLERLRRGAVPAPTIAEIEPEVESEDSAVAQGNATRIGGEASATGSSGLPETDPLVLDRLSSLRPEIAIPGTSAWVLVVNPAEVREFMRKTYDRGDLDRDVDVSVSVTLWIDERGSVEWSEISESSGRRDFDEIALALFNEVARFQPARRGGVRVPISATFSVYFPW